MWEFVILQNYLSVTESSIVNTSDKKFQIFSSSYMGSFVSVSGIFRKMTNLINTLKCLSIGTPKISNFPFVLNGKLMILGVPIFKHIIMRLYSALILGHLKIMNFPFGTNGKFIILGVPILKHIRVLAIKFS